MLYECIICKNETSDPVIDGCLVYCRHCKGQKTSINITVVDSIVEDIIEYFYPGLFWKDSPAELTETQQADLKDIEDNYARIIRERLNNSGITIR